MHEMVLNHASLLSPDLYSGVVWLDDVIRGMSQLTRNKVADSALRMHRIPHETRCHPDISLHDVLLALQRAGKREEHRFFPDWRKRFPSCTLSGPNFPWHETDGRRGRESSLPV